MQGRRVQTRTHRYDMASHYTVCVLRQVDPLRPDAVSDRAGSTTVRHNSFRSGPQSLRIAKTSARPEMAAGTKGFLTEPLVLPGVFAAHAGPPHDCLSAQNIFLEGHIAASARVSARRPLSA